MSSGPVWFLGMGLAVFGACRARGLYRRIQDITGYMRAIESHWPRLEAERKVAGFHPTARSNGWELYRNSPEAKPHARRNAAIALWAVLLFLSVLIPLARMIRFQ